MDEITNQHADTFRADVELTSVPVESKDVADMTDREILIQTLDLVRETHASQRATQAMVEGVIAEVGPMVESFANNPALKMLGFGKKFGL